MTGRWRTRSCRGNEQYEGGNVLESMLDGLLELDLFLAPSRNAYERERERAHCSSGCGKGWTT
jgi:hypothetical protein